MYIQYLVSLRKNMFLFILMSKMKFQVEVNRM